MKLSNVFRTEIVPVAPFSFELTVKKPAGWSLFNAGEIYEDEAL